MAETILHNVLEKGVSAGASDIHIKENSAVCFRIDGEMLSSDFIADKEMLSRFIRQVSSDPQFDEFNKSGDLDISHAEPGVGRFRVNVHRQRGMICLNFRYIKNTIMTLEQLGLPSSIRQITEMPRGIVILCGTTGSGKSTTLAAMLEYVNANLHRHIITIEDPIEYEFTDKSSFFEQREVGLDTISFQSALRHVLRQDPDIIMVGEMRDKFSFEAALQAADTGHMVMTTLHSSNATQAINRILDFYPKEEQGPILEALSNNLCATISQRLIPKAFGGGRVPACEIMINTPIVRKLLLDARLDKLPNAVSAGRNDGMMSFNQCLVDLVNNGIITEEDALEAATNPEALKMNFQGIFLETDNQIIN